MNWTVLYALLSKKISKMEGVHNEVVEELPSTGQENVCYFVPKDEPGTNDIYDEYIWTDSDGYEKIGSTQIDLTGYLKDEDVAAVALSGDYDDLDNKPDLSGYLTSSDVGEAAISNSYADLDNKPDIPAVDSVLDTTSHNAIENQAVANKINEIAFKSTDASDIFIKRAISGILNPAVCNMRSLTGASVVWNQLVENGNFTSTTGWSANRGTISASNNVCTFTPTEKNGNARLYKNVTVVVGHKYLVACTFSATEATTPRLCGYQFGSISANTNTRLSAVVTFDNASTEFNMNPSYPSGMDTTETAKISNFIVTDLTAMFGSTIADYVNTLETQTAGSGIAWLKSYGFFTEDYYAYSANKIESVSVSGKKYVGKNQCDTSAFNGVSHYTVNADGSITVNSSDTRSWSSVSEIPLKAGTYTVSKSGTTGTSDIRLSTEEFNTGHIFATSFTFTLATDGSVKVKLAYAGVTYPQTYTLQIESGSTATAYKPYTETTYPLDHTTLRGLFKLDANNNLYADGDIYPSDGNGSVKYDEVDLGSLDWTYDNPSGVYRFEATISGRYYSNDRLNALCTKYTIVDIGVSVGIPDKSISMATGSAKIFIVDSSYTDAPTLKSSLNGVKFLYQKATPTTQTLTPFNSIQNIENGGTEEFIDYGVEQGTRDVEVPVYVEETYNSDPVLDIMEEYVDQAITTNITSVLNSSY